MVFRVTCQSCRFRHSGGKVTVEAKAASHSLRRRHSVIIIDGNNRVVDSITPPEQDDTDIPPF